MQLSVVLIDDEPEALAMMRTLLDAFPEIEILGAATDGDEGLRMITELKPDLALLDIQMPRRSGLEIARLVAAGSDTEIIFVTAYTDFAADAFDLEAVDYLVKPVRPDRLREAVRRAHRRLQQFDPGSAGLPEAAAPKREAPQYQQSIWVPSRNGGIRLPVADIRRIEAARDYALLYTRTRTHIVRVTMGELESKLDPVNLLRIQRSLFVRPDIVARIEKSGRKIVRLETDDGAILDVGASYAGRVADALDPGGELAPTRRRRPD